MIQKAIVESIENDYQIKIRIPKFDKMSYDGTSFGDLSTSIVCSSPGTIVNYSVGDIVLVGFENNEISKPVILGLLYTENNTGDSIKFPAISNKLDNVTQAVNKLQTTQSYIHIKYSNDNGNTFTSLYDYANAIYDSAENIYSDSNITIDVQSSQLFWDITDNVGNNAGDDFNITTTVTAILGNNTPVITSYTDKVIKLPDVYKYYDSILISYEMTPLKGDREDYYIALYTDKNPIGSIEGDYIGFYYSTNNFASSNPIDYSWASIKVRVQKFIDEAYNNLLKRVQTNERYLYGKAQEDSINTNTGINSAIQISESTLDISNKSNIYLSENKSIRIDSDINRLVFNNIYIEASNDGHLKVKAL